MDLNLAGFGHMFPYSNIHELNLDWLLAKLRELEYRVLDLERRMDEAERRIEDHEQRIIFIEAEIAKLRQEWEAFKQYVEDRFDQLEQEIRDLFTQLEAKIDAKFAQLEHELNDKFTQLESDLKSQVQDILKYIIDTCAEFTAKVTALEIRVLQIETDMQDCCQTINSKLVELLEELNKLNPDLIRKVITSNGVYKAKDDGANGYYEVEVNVPTGGGSDILVSSMNKVNRYKVPFDTTVTLPTQPITSTTTLGTYLNCLPSTYSNVLDNFSVRKDFINTSMEAINSVCVVSAMVVFDSDSEINRTNLLTTLLKYNQNTQYLDDTDIISPTDPTSPIGKGSWWNESAFIDDTKDAVITVPVDSRNRNPISITDATNHGNGFYITYTYNDLAVGVLKEYVNQHLGETKRVKGTLYFSQFGLITQES